jgi:hypothetical protein
MANDLEFSLGLDVSPMQRAGATIAKFGDDTVKVLNKKFSGADLFRGILQGVGIASVGQIAEKLIAPFRESAESAQRIAEWTDKAAAATERLLNSRKNDAQQLAAMEKQYKRIAEEAQKPAEVSFWRKMMVGAALRMGASGTAAGLLENRDANAEKQAEAAAALAQKALEIEEKKKAIQDKTFEQEMRNAKLRSDYVKSHREELELEAKLKAGRILPAEKATLDVLRLQNKEHEINQRIQDILEKYPEERTEAERRTLSELFRQRDVLGKQVEIKQELLAASTRQAAAEEKIGDVIESNIAKWEQFTGAINSFGRGDRELSDRELQRKIQNLNDDIFRRQLNTQNGSYDFFLSPQKSNLAQALAEQKLRDRVRRDVSAFGEDRAFQMNDGLTEQRFAEITRGLNDSEKTVKALDQLRINQERGLQAIAETLKAINT